MKMNKNCSSKEKSANHVKIKVSVCNVDKSNEKEYNPHEHRILEHPNTFSGALIHLLKSCLGTGILAVPRAFKNAGLIVGLFGTIFIGVLCTHTIHLLVAASQKVCRKTRVPSLGYAETAEGVFRNGPKVLRNWSTFAKNFVEIGLVLTYFCGTAVYIVFISTSLRKLVSYYYPEAENWDQFFKVMLLVPLILCCQIRELKHLVPFSFLANTTMIVAFSITLYYMFSGLTESDLDERNLTTSLSGIPSFFSTVIFAMEGIGTIMPVENSMTEPKFASCFGVLNTAMAMVVTLYTAIGFFGYLRFGEETQATITSNLPSDETPAQVTQASISAAVFLTFMLQFYVPIDITWRRIKDRIPQERHNISQILIRTGLVMFVMGIAAAAGHHLDGLIDLVGAIFYSTLGLLVPAFIDIIVNIDEGYGVFHWKLIKNILVMVLALFGLFAGSYYAILGITEDN